MPDVAVHIAECVFAKTLVLTVLLLSFIRQRLLFYSNILQIYFYSMGYIFQECEGLRVSQRCLSVVIMEIDVNNVLLRTVDLLCLLLNLYCYEYFLAHFFELDWFLTF
jgi:hypothetical protein